jgi:hypothetical protein
MGDRETIWQQSWLVVVWCRKLWWTREGEDAELVTVTVVEATKNTYEKHARIAAMDKDQAKKKGRK